MTDQIEMLLSESYVTGGPDIEAAWRKGRRRRQVKRGGSIAAAVAVVAAGVVSLSAIHSRAGHRVTTAVRPASVPDPFLSG
jgi:hypothetical protein